MQQALWLIDSWLHAPDQIQMYPDHDTIAHMPNTTAHFLFLQYDCSRESLNNYITKHLIYGPFGKLVSFVFPWVLIIPTTKSVLLGKQN